MHGYLFEFEDVVVTGPVTLVARWVLLAPTVTGADTATATAGETFTYMPTISGAEVVASASGLPEGLTVDDATGVIAGTPADVAGSYEVTLTVENSAGSDTHTFLLTLERGVAASFSVEASDLAPKQGDTIVITVTALDAAGNEWDASADAVITSDHASDEVSGNTVTFPSASPHVITVSLYELPSQTITVDVEPTETVSDPRPGTDADGELGTTGADVPWLVLAFAALALLVGVGIIVGRRVLARRSR